jgi:hypothetical protein
VGEVVAPPGYAPRETRRPQAAALNVPMPPPGCTLSADELTRQRARIRALAPLVTKVARAVERRCCSFLDFDYECETCRLAITADNDHQAALDHFVPTHRR